MVVYLAIQVLPRIIPFFWAADYKRFFYEDLGFSETRATFLSHVFAYVCGTIWIPLAGWTLYVAFWRFDARKFALGLIGTVVLYGHLPLLVGLYGGEVCANQRTGEPLKWYVVETGGAIILYDSPGFDKVGTAKRPATAQVCRIRELQKKGIQPHAITLDPRSIEFFSGVKEPRVWYFKAENGSIDLFDAEGTHPGVGEILRPITPEIAQEARERAMAAQATAENNARLAVERAAAESATAENNARLALERAAAESKDKARTDLVDLFGTTTYPRGVVVMGIAPQQKDGASGQAARGLLNAMAANLRAKGISVDEFRPRVYSSGYFEKMLGGSTAVLSEVGLSQILRAALLASVDTTCRPTTGIAGSYSCSLSAELRIVQPTGVMSVRRWTETGAGPNTSQAAARAVELLVERNPGWLDGI